MKIIKFLACCLLFTIMSSGTLMAQAFIEYKVNGVEYKASEDQLLSFTAYRKDDNDKKKNKYVAISVSGIYNILYRVEISLDVKLDKKIEPITYKVGESMQFMKVLPIGALKVIKNVGDDYEFYESGNATKGKIVITKVEGDWMEGTFDGELIPQYPLKSKVLMKVTDGKFRVPISEIN